MLAPPVGPLDNFLIAQAMSRKVEQGRVPSFDEARRYAMEQSPQEPINRYEDRRG
jgi:hypothetical protein